MGPDSEVVQDEIIRILDEGSMLRAHGFDLRVREQSRVVAWPGATAACEVLSHERNAQSLFRGCVPRCMTGGQWLDKKPLALLGTDNSSVREGLATLRQGNSAATIIWLSGLQNANGDFVHRQVTSCQNRYLCVRLFTACWH